MIKAQKVLLQLLCYISVTNTRDETSELKRLIGS